MQKTGVPYYQKEYNLHNCENEPLRRIRRCQVYGALIACKPIENTWSHASSNILDLLDNNNPRDVIINLTKVDVTNLNLTKDISYISENDAKFSAIIHRRGEHIIVEMEPNTGQSVVSVGYSDFQESILELTGAGKEDEYHNKIINQVYRITNYDQIMIYKFDEDYSGTIVAEKKRDENTSYLGLKFPASDIPKQARDLYFQEKTRIIYDTVVPQIPLIENENNTDRHSLDLTKVTIRGVSPIHIEYLRNINVGASFSVAITKDDKLWGLIACHNSEPRFIDYQTRDWLNFLSSLISKNIDKIVKNTQEVNEIEQQLNRSKMMEEVVIANDLIEGMLKDGERILNFVKSDGVIVKSDTNIKSTGDLPDEQKVHAMAKWVAAQYEKEFDCLSFEKSTSFLPDHLHDDKWTGIFILQLSHRSKDYIIWTRNEKATEVMWAGNPNVTKVFDKEKGRLTPRKSFDKWKETVTDRSAAWTEQDVATARILKKELREHLYKKYNEIMLLNKELSEAYQQMESFSYSVSHDLKAPLRSIEGFATILKEEYEDKLDQYGVNLLNTITESITKMNRFIREILNYSKLNRDSIEILKIDLNELIKKDWTLSTINESNGETLVFDYNIPPIYGDLNMLNQLFSNLISNSLKYVAKDVIPNVKIWHEVKENFVKIYFEDNGIGIPEDQRVRVFEVFRRLVRDDEYEGTGVGMSIVKKVIERHRGTIFILDPVSSKEGSLFVFTLPINKAFINTIINR